MDINASAAGSFSLGSGSVHRIGYGAMQLPGPGVMGPPKDRAEALAVLRRAIECGVNHIDTAQFYGPDVANELIREALHPYPSDLALVSKVGAERDSAGGFVARQAPAELRQGVEDNLAALGVEQLAVVNLRRVELPGTDSVELDDQLAELAALRDEGKIGGIGLSNVTPDEVSNASRSVGIVCVQNPYSLVDRSDQATLELCAEQGIAYVPFFPLGSAFPGHPKVVDHAAARSVAERFGVTPAQVGLAWLLARSPNILLIPGTSSVAHLEENLAVGSIELSSEDLAELNQPTDA